MYQIGDLVFYPMHGAGVIEAIEEREVLGEKQCYYVINLSHRKIQVMVPIQNIDKLGIRELVELDVIENVLVLFKNKDQFDTNTHPNQRYRNYMEKIKSGDIFEGAKVIHDLSTISKRKTLGTGDKTMLNNAKQILISELVFVKGIEADDATTFLDNVINN